MFTIIRTAQFKRIIQDMMLKTQTEINLFSSLENQIKDLKNQISFLEGKLGVFIPTEKKKPGRPRKDKNSLSGALKKVLKKEDEKK